MKKLTTGIFTVLLGLVAIDANAAVTSQAYVDAQVKDVDTKVTNLTTDVNNFTTNIGSTITDEIKRNLDNPESDIAKTLEAKADKTQVATDIATAIAGEADRAKAAEKANSDAIGALQTSKQDKLTQAANAGDNISIDEAGKISVTGLADAEGVAELKTTVQEHTEAINTLNTEQDAQDAKITANETAISAINNETTGILAQAKTDATTKADKALEDAKTYADGLGVNYATKEQGAKADAADAAIKTYGDIVTHNTNEFATAAQGTKAETALQKNGTLTPGHLVTTNENGEIIDAGAKGALANKDTVAATDIDADAVITAKIKDKNVTMAKLDDSVQASLNKADISIPMVKTNNANGVYVLTATALDGNVTYAWEDITRGTDGAAE